MPAHRARRLVALPLLSTALSTALVAGSWTATVPAADAAPTTHAASASVAEKMKPKAQKVRRAFAVAHDQIGDPYQYGANGPNAFDCSGLTSFAYHKAGLKMPRTSGAQYRHLRGIQKHNIKRGDLVAFHDGPSVYHVGLFVGWKGGKRLVLHSPNSGSKVRIQKIWTSSWWAATARPKH